MSNLERRIVSWLSPKEWARHERFRTDHLRHSYLATRWLCRTALSRYTGVDGKDWTFVDNANGKPAIAGPAQFAELRFNLTHTEGLLACAVSRAGEVGIDAEEISRSVDFEGIAANFFSQTERAALESLSPQDRPGKFMEYWVLKEAYLKGCGTGFSQPPEGFTIKWADDGQPLPIADWQLSMHRPTSHHVAAVAVRPHAAMTPVPIIWREIKSLEWIDSQP